MGFLQRIAHLRRESRLPLNCGMRFSPIDRILTVDPATAMNSVCPLMNERPESLTRQLGRRYRLVFAAIAGVLLLDQALLQPMLVRLTLSAPAINLAGRQRMHSQRLTKCALALARSPADSQPWSSEMKTALADWQRVHRALREGDATLRIPAPANLAIQQALAELDLPFEGLIAALQAVLRQPDDSSAALSAALAYEPLYLQTMDRIVGLYEAEAQRQVLRLRVVGALGAVAVLLMLLGLYYQVLRPATQLVRAQVVRLAASEQNLLTAREELESRVEQRTRELQEANAALADEVSERDRAEQRTLQLQSQLAHASRVTSLGQLATGIAHEINQPLGAVTNYAETLLLLADREPPDGTALRSIATRLRDAALRAGQIVRRMRNFVQQRPESRSEEFLNALIQDVLDLCEHDLRSQSVRIVRDWTATDGLTVCVDSVQIQQVLVNLVRNAVQSMESQPVEERELTVRTERSAAEIAVHVADCGPGFATEPQASFAPLTSTKSGGMGLGLSISQTIIEAHHGCLTAVNRAPRGARVSFTLPLQKVAGHREPADSLHR